MTTNKSVRRAARAEAETAWKAEVERQRKDMDVVVGTRVCGGEGEDYDEGRIVAIDGDNAMVAWDSGVRTTVRQDDLRVL